MTNCLCTFYHMPRVRCVCPCHLDAIESSACPRCGGHGRVIREITPGVIVAGDICSACRGSGIVPEQAATPNHDCRPQPSKVAPGYEYCPECIPMYRKKEA